MAAKDIIFDEKARSRVQSGEAIAIVTRGAQVWNIDDEIPGVIIYGKYEARGAHLGPESPGGEAILTHLERIGLGKGKGGILRVKK